MELDNNIIINSVGEEFKLLFKLLLTLISIQFFL